MNQPCKFHLHSPRIPHESQGSQSPSATSPPTSITASLSPLDILNLSVIGFKVHSGQMLFQLSLGQTLWSPPTQNRTLWRHSWWCSWMASVGWQTAELFYKPERDHEWVCHCQKSKWWLLAIQFEINFRMESHTLVYKDQQARSAVCTQHVMWFEAVCDSLRWNQCLQQ